MSKIIVTAALTGGGPKEDKMPYLPTTPELISDDAANCRKEGAAIVHIHARDPATGAPSSKTEHFRDIAKMIKEKSDVVVNTTTGGSAGMTLEERISVVRELKPELASLNMGSMNFYRAARAASYTAVFANTFDQIEYFSKVMQETGTKPECEVYDLGMLDNLKFMADKGVVKMPVHIQFVLGVVGGAAASVENANFLRATTTRYFPGSTWSVCATGRHEMPMITWSLIEGGNLRVGLEDNYYLSKGVLAKSSAELVAKAVRILKELGHETATPDEARQILGLKGSDKVAF
jgi:uncharacterized protein (DUF849 family)